MDSNWKEEFIQKMSRSRWRIPYIPYEKEVKVESNGLAALGALVFLGSVGFLSFKIMNNDAPKGITLYLVGAVAGLVLGIFGVWSKARRERQKWVKVNAKCIDREWQRIQTTRGSAAGGMGGGWTWAFRLLCEFDFQGKHFKVTPGYWTTFISEESLKSFFDKRIATDGLCELWVNPKNPLQAELIGDDIKDKLLH